METQSSQSAAGRAIASTPRARAHEGLPIGGIDVAGERKRSAETIWTQGKES